jgi:hypothetical protein
MEFPIGVVIRISQLDTRVGRVALSFNLVMTLGSVVIFFATSASTLVLVAALVIIVMVMRLGFSLVIGLDLKRIESLIS